MLIVASPRHTDLPTLHRVRLWLPLHSAYPKRSRHHAAMSDLTKALKYAREHRAIHEGWLQHWKDNPPVSLVELQEMESTGGIAWQQKCIKRYNIIIRALENA